jgi:predicted dinucleotide-binding enzyme
MNIGIIGSGNIGANAARLFVRAGHDVALSNSRGGQGLEALEPLYLLIRTLMETNNKRRWES